MLTGLARSGAPGIGSRLYKLTWEAVNYRLRGFAGGALAGYCRPTSIVILLTERCNARCLHCDIWKNRGKEDSPSLDEWKKVLTDIRQWLGPVQVTFSGGEALLKPFATDLVAHGSAIGLFIELLTHGYWLEHARIERLAEANPWRVTVSLDGLGSTHDRVRGRDGFFARTISSIETLRRASQHRRTPLPIRLKTVVMSHNLSELGEVARFARDRGLEVFYQPIEQNYNTPEDPRWFEHSDNWPKDTAAAVAAVSELMELKRRGLPIVNSRAQLEAMAAYFRDPDSLRVAVQSHSAHERRQHCMALTMLQLQANGDVVVCTSLAPVGNVKGDSIRRIWEARPRVWEEGCCLGRRSQPTPSSAGAVPRSETPISAPRLPVSTAPGHVEGDHPG